MPYRLAYSKIAEREIKRLDSTILRRVINAIEQLQTDPRPRGCKKLVGREEWRIKVGDWRVIYRIEDHVLIVTVIRVSHRSDAYK
ncbi:MAG: type II toxin-antitoxin system RelE/ParE family toxin [Rhodospirillaceae bacterium]|nr:type II toxin-antitoxin system RelE/ParE family toxin [Rhodospirillaceae bacterium]